MQVLSDVNLLQVLQLEGLPVLLSHILALSKAVEVENQVHQLLVCLVIVERNYRDAVVELISERIHGVVHDNQVVEVSVRDDPQVLHVDALFRSDAVISVKSVLD